MSNVKLQAFLFCAFVCVGLQFDTGGLFRMVLLCSFLHECGHITAYVLCTRQWPQISLRLGGVALTSTQTLSHRHTFAVLCAGPGANFVCALFALCVLAQRATYARYFFLLVNLCLGFYNLLPVGTLDGNGLLQCFVPAQWLPWYRAVSKVLTLIFCAGVAAFAVFMPLSAVLRVALLLLCSYLVLQNLFCG